jgi:hypothetical protein
MEVGLRELYQFPVFLDVEYSLWYMSLSPNREYTVSLYHPRIAILQYNTLLSSFS